MAETALFCRGLQGLEVGALSNCGYHFQMPHADYVGFTSLGSVVQARLGELVF